ncbi:MAG TPA: DUF983 domain-containing protein [Stellaceae bacterium]|nr:DUF983 domain-containing protein [Stellaceae bacterium]
MSGAESYPPVSVLAVALRCRCPRCGEGKLYNGLLSVAPRFAVCGLDLAAEDTGDGAAVFVVLILGAIVVGLAILVEVVFAPPFWVHIVLWTPFIIGGAIAMLRPLKAWLIAMQFRHHLLG